MLLLAVPVLAQPDRIATAIDPAHRITLTGNVHPRTKTVDDLGLADPSFEIRGITLQLQPSPAQQQDLQHLLAAQQDANSPDFHHWLTPERYADRFGISAGDISKITAWLGARGLRIDSIARGRNWINFSGTASELEAAFGVHTHRYRVGGKIHYANADPPSIPAALSGLVAGVLGLDDFRMGPLASPKFNNASGGHNLVPGDIATIYNTAPLVKGGIDGTVVKVAIVGGSAINISDIRTFRSTYGLPAKDPQLVIANADPGTVAFAAAEGTLDIEWAGALAPGASIIYVYDQNPNAAVQYIVNNNLAQIMNTSYGGCESLNPGATDLIAQQANVQGITWIASTGDTGAAACDASASGSPAAASQGLSVNVPASFPEVTAVGATAFNEGSGTYWSATNGPNLASVLSYIPEVAWNDTALVGILTASGGGASIVYPKPLWQNAAGVPADGARDVPDVAFAGSPNHDGYLVYLNGTFQVFGGTSVSTPVFSGMVALLNHSLVSRGIAAQPGLGNINPTLYRLARTTTNVFHDITQGNNIVPCVAGSPNCNNGSFGFFAGPGYDQVTGLGSVDVANLASQWTIPAAVASSVIATATPNPSYTQKVTLNLAETNGGATTLTGFTFNGQDYSSQIVSFFGTSTIEAYGTISAKLALTNPTLPATSTFGFSGADPSGRTWAQQLSVQFYPAQPAGATTVAGVSNGASFKTVFAPGMIMSVFGTNFATAAQAASSLPLPDTMQGVTATVNGVTAPLYFVSSGQVNLQVPYGTAAGPAMLSINGSGGTATFPFTVQANAPGIFASAGALVPYSTGKVGDSLLIFMTGEGAVSPAIATGATPAPSTPFNQLPMPVASVAVTVGGVTAPIAFVGIPSGLAGVTQINFVIPPGVSPGVQPVIVTIGGISSPAVTLTVTR
jgi:uncharacterized protein (TIGR03437 family)